jgi:hypothetical protein
MNQHTLDQEAPGLARHLPSLSLERQQELLIEAVLLMSQDFSADLDEKTLALLKVLRSTRKLTIQEAGLAMALAEAADREYFEWKDRGVSQAEWGSGFRKGAFYGGLRWALALRQPKISSMPSRIHPRCTQALTAECWPPGWQRNNQTSERPNGDETESRRGYPRR